MAVRDWRLIRSNQHPPRYLPKWVASLAAVGVMVTVQLLAVWLATRSSSGGGTAANTGGAAPTGSGDPMDVVVLFGGILLWTAVLVGLWRGPWWLRRGLAVLLAAGFTGWLLWVASRSPLFFSVVALSVVTTYLIVTRVPLWLLLDGLAIVAGAGAAAAIGMQLAPGLVVGLFAILLVYDLVAVHISGHMESLVRAAVEWGLPAVIMIPRHRGFNARAWLEAKLSADGGHDYNCGLMIGTGDFAIPSALTVAALQLDAGIDPAVGAALGTLAAMGVLLADVFDVDMQAGLPYLCSGAIAGYIVGAVGVGLSVWDALTWGVAL